MNLEVRLMKRIYSILVFGNEENDIMLVLKFTDQKFQSLTDFLNSEVHNFKTELYYQMDAESLGEPCFISTDELYKLVIEWKEMKDRMHRGENIFPLMIDD